MSIIMQRVPHDAKVLSCFADNKAKVRELALCNLIDIIEIKLLPLITDILKVVPVAMRIALHGSFDFFFSH